MIGQLLAGRYRILHVLGAGGFGQTYIAADLHLPGQPQCVLKHLRPASANPEVLTLARQFFQKEAETLQQLGNHDQIPRLLAFFEENQEFYLVQEYIVGHTLSYELGSQRPWSETAVLRLLREALTVLEFVHNQGVIHRDVKPDNIMRRDSDGQLVLIDFGAIKLVRTPQIAQTGTGTVTKTVAIGTPGYMPSEQAAGAPRPSSDIYALGVIAIQALTGLHPTELQEDEATGELCWQHLVQANPRLVDLLSKMTRYHFKERYLTAREALQALRQLEPAAPPPTTPPTYQPPTPTVQNSSPPTQPETSPDPTRVVIKIPPSYNQPRLVVDTRLERKSVSPLLKSLVGIALLVVSAGIGYWLVRLAQFDAQLQTDRCRIASPNRNSVTRVRDRPDRLAPVTVELKMGEQLLFVATQEAFVQIEQRNGYKGWVFNDQIKVCPGMEVAAPPKPSSSSSGQSPPPIVIPSSKLPLFPGAKNNPDFVLPKVSTTPSSTTNSFSASPSPTLTPSASPSSPSYIPVPSTSPSNPFPTPQVSQPYSIEPSNPTLISPTPLTPESSSPIPSISNSPLPSSNGTGF